MLSLTFWRRNYFSILAHPVYIYIYIYIYIHYIQKVKAVLRKAQNGVTESGGAVFETLCYKRGGCGFDF